MAEKLIKRGKVWYYRFTDANGKRVMRRGCTDKRATEEMARAAEIEAAKIRAGLIDPKEAAYRGHEAKPLADHLADWRAFLLGRDRSRRHADEGHARVAKLMTLAKADRLSDLVLTRVQAALAALRDEGLSLRTVHHYARLVKNFTKWAWRDGRTREDLLAHLQPPDNPESDRRRVRRALTVPELARLIEAAESGPVRRQLSGIDRAMLYRITAGTGFRSEEMQSLTPESFDLDGSCPTITVEAADSKRRRRDVQPIQPALASLLRPWLAGRPQSQPVFPVDRWAILEALKADEAAAGIAYKNEEGFADFHALRHTYITALAKSNAPVKIVQSLARHSTPVLTLGVYTHLGLYDQAPALDALPDLTRPAPGSEPSILAATGTDGRFDPRLLSDPTGPAAPDPEKSRADRATHRKTFAPSLRHSGDVSRRDQTLTDVMAGSGSQPSMAGKPLENKAPDAYSRVQTLADAQGGVSVAGARPGLQNR